MGTLNEDILPVATGLNLGNTSQRWDAFINALNANSATVNGTLTVNGAFTVPFPSVFQTGVLQLGGTGDTGLSRGGAAVVAVGNGTSGDASGTVNAAQYNVAGSQIAAANLSNGVTGAGSVVLSNGPTLLGNVLPTTTGTQSLGSSSERWNASLATVDAKSLNGELNALDFTGGDIGAQVNAAIAALPATGGTVYIPAGSYTQTSTIYLPRTVLLRGASAYGTKLNYTTSTGWAIVIADGLGTSIYPEGGVTDLSLVGPSSSGTAGGIYFGGSDTGSGSYTGTPVASPTTGNDAAANYGDHANVNRVRITLFRVGAQFGNNTWSVTFMQSVLTSNGTGVIFPASTTNSGERLSFLGCSIQNSTIGVLMASGGSQVDVDFFFDACSFDFNSSWAIQNLNAVWITCFLNCHVEQVSNWLQTYGYCVLVGCTFTQGSSSGTLGYLIDNQSTTGFSVHGGWFFNAGSGTILNTASQPSVWLGALMNGTGGSLVGASGIIDSTGNGLLATLKTTGKITSYNGIATVANGVPSEIVQSNLTAQAANISLTNFYTPTANTLMRVTAYAGITQSASSGSTFPAFTITWTDANSGVSRSVAWNTTQTSNSTTGTFFYNNSFINVKANTAVQITSAGYASTGGTPMQFDFTARLELL